MTIKERIIILNESNQIDDDVRQRLIKLVTDFEKELNIKLDEENSSMFITHLAVAMTRTKESNTVNMPDEDLITELKESENYVKMNNLYVKLCDFMDFKFPEEEKWFILVHLNGLL